MKFFGQLLYLVYCFFQSNSNRKFIYVTFIKHTVEIHTDEQRQYGRTVGNSLS